jgi:addiction module HigA family antidote
MSRSLTPIHPGQTIEEDFLSPLQMSVNQLAKALDIDAARLNEIVRVRRGITADTALRLALSRHIGRVLDTPSGRLRIAGGASGGDETDRA